MFFAFFALLCDLCVEILMFFASFALLCDLCVKFLF